MEKVPVETMEFDYKLAGMTEAVCLMKVLAYRCWNEVIPHELWVTGTFAADKALFAPADWNLEGLTDRF